MRKLVQHLEGDGHLGNSSSSLAVRYCVDIWNETIPLGSGRNNDVQRVDGFIWVINHELPKASNQSLTMQDGRTLNIRLTTASGRAMFVADAPPSP